MEHLVRLTPRKTALIAVFSALYYVMSFLPGIKVATGATNVSIQIEAFMASVFGLIMGPYTGSLTAFMGALLAWLLPPGTPSPTSAVFLLSPVINAFVVGLVYRGNWKTAFVTLAIVISAFWLLPATQPWTQYSYIGFFVMWDKIGALMLILPLAVLLRKIAKDAIEAKPIVNIGASIQKIDITVILVTAAAILILANAWIIAIGENPKYEFNFLGTTFKLNLVTKEMLPIVSPIGYGWLLLGFGIIVCGVLLQLKPRKRGIWSTVIFLFSCSSALIGGGYVVGLFLGVLGSILGYLTRRFSLSRLTFLGDMFLYFLLAFVGNEADNALGSLIFGLPPVYEGLFMMNLEVLRLSFIVAPFFYFSIRLLQAIITALVATPLLRSLKSSGFNVSQFGTST
jgi:hypothetical protein